MSEMETIIWFTVGSGVVLAAMLGLLAWDGRRGRERTNERYALLAEQTNRFIREGKRETLDAIQEMRASTERANTRQEEWLRDWRAETREDRRFLGRLMLRSHRETRALLRKMDQDHKDTQVYLRMMMERWNGGGSR